MKFDPLFVTPQWLKEFHTKYPHGLSVMENIIEWVNQVNELIDWVNVTPEKMAEMLAQWQADGTLNNIISEALQTEIDTVRDNLNDFIEIYNRDSKPFTPEQYGAVGDGISDDSAAITDMFTAAPEGSTILLKGTYLMTASVVITKSFNIDGQNTGKLIAGANGLNNLLDFSGVTRMTLRDLEIDMNSKGRTAVKFVDCDDLLVDHCIFRGYTAAYGYYQTDSAILLDSVIRFIVSGCTFDGFGAGYTPNEYLVRAITNQPTDLHRGGIIRNNFFKNANQGIVSTGKEVTIEGNQFEGTTDNSIYILGASENVLITNNIFRNGTDEDVVVAGKNISVNNNTFIGTTNKMIAINNCDNLTIDGNTFHAPDGVTGVIQQRDTDRACDGLTITNNRIDVKGTYITMGQFSYFRNVIFSGNNITSTNSDDNASIVRFTGNDGIKENLLIANNLIKCIKTVPGISVRGIRIDGDSVPNVRLIGNLLIDCGYAASDPTITAE